LYKLVGQLGTVQQDDASIEHNVFWNESYFIASCGGVTVEVLKKYVQSQGEFDRDGVASYEGLCGEVNSPP
jgi:REP element-mobilizing transposase RayT